MSYRIYSHVADPYHLHLFGLDEHEGTTCVIDIRLYTGPANEQATAAFLDRTFLHIHQMRTSPAAAQIIADLARALR